MNSDSFDISWLESEYSEFLHFQSVLCIYAWNATYDHERIAL